MSRLSLATAFVAIAFAASIGYGQEPLSSLIPPSPSDSVDLLPPPAPAVLDTGEELAALQTRIRELEKAEEERNRAESAKKEADALRPTIKWTGQLQADFYSFGQDEANEARFGDIENGEAFRRARFGMFGDYGPTEYRIEVDFALAGRPSFVDVWAGVKDVPYLGRVRVGHFFEPFSLERSTPNRFVTFMERALPDQPFAPARNLGVMAQNTYLDERGTWALGLFRSDSDQFGDDAGDEFEHALTGRLTYLPWYASEGRQYLHLGAAGSVRDTNNDLARFRAQPESRIGAASPNVPFFVDTGNIPAESFGLVGLEAAGVNGPLHVAFEYMFVPVNVIDAADLVFSGWYLETGYFLTGEHRPYRRNCGTFDRVIPLRDFLKYHGDGEDRCIECGPGAWQIAARLSGLDLEEDSVRGGSIMDTTLAVNWHLNPYLRVTANWIHAVVDGRTGESDADVFATRVGYEF